MPIRPPADDGWNEFMQDWNTRAAPTQAQPKPALTTRAARRRARKRTNCAICQEALGDTGRPMTRGRWRCDVEAPCRARRARQDDAKAAQQ